MLGRGARRAHINQGLQLMTGTVGIADFENGHRQGQLGFRVWFAETNRGLKMAKRVLSTLTVELEQAEIVMGSR